MQACLCVWQPGNRSPAAGFFPTLGPERLCSRRPHLHFTHMQGMVLEGILKNKSLLDRDTKVGLCSTTSCLPLELGEEIVIHRKTFRWAEPKSLGSEEFNQSLAVHKFDGHNTCRLWPLSSVLNSMQKMTSAPSKTASMRLSRRGIGYARGGIVTQKWCWRGYSAWRASQAGGGRFRSGSRPRNRPSSRPKQHRKNIPIFGSGRTSSLPG